MTLIFRKDAKIEKLPDGKVRVFVPPAEGEEPFEYIAEDEREAWLALEFPVYALRSPSTLKGFREYPYQAFFDNLCAGDYS